jgi:hypothetical protein
MDLLTIKGKKSSQIAKEYGLAICSVNLYARNHDIPYYSFEGSKRKVGFYVFDEAAEEAFKNRNTKPTGRPMVEKPPKVPGKRGRPRKEKPVDNTPKNPVGRPRKYPKTEQAPVKKPKKTKKKKVLTKKKIRGKNK